jgi:hypothetical protein
MTPVVNITTGERFESVGDAARSVGVSGPTMSQNLRRPFARPIKGNVFEYEHILEKRNREESD